MVMIRTSPWQDHWRRVLPVIAGLALLYGPVYLDLATSHWLNGHSPQGPVVLTLLVWLVLRERTAFARSEDGFCGECRTPKGALALFGSGLLCYTVGRTQELLQLELASQVPVLLGLSRTLLGTMATRRLAFAIVFSVFLIPAPGTLLDGILMPLKQWVSALADASLHLAGYPVARTGVMLTIGHYDLLIADACSGLNSMIALSGVGLLYVHVAARGFEWRSIVLLAGVLPVAFAANVLRVVVLLLVTYYAGDDAGRAFHSAAAYLEVAFAFGCLFGIDRLTARLSSVGGRLQPHAHLASDVVSAR
jgi:exosortase